jgi:alpha,alpha-trehalase
MSLKSRFALGWLLVACRAHETPPPESPPRPSATPATVAAPPAGAPEFARTDAQAALCRVLADRDRDCDKRITLADEACAAPPCPAPFPYDVGLGGARVHLASRQQAAQFVQELVLGLRASSAERIPVDLTRVTDDPVAYLEHRINDHFWAALTRRIDAEPGSLERALTDPKLAPASGASAELCPLDTRRCSPPVPAPAVTPVEQHVYVPSDDAQALLVFARAGVPGRVSLHPLPVPASPEWVKGVTERKEHGLLTLALDAQNHGRPFVVPGGRFNELYGWDSYFIVRGLTQRPENTALARAIVENQAYEIRHYGKILNANRSYFLTRSQPPFFTSSIAAVLERSGSTWADRAWLATMVSAALAEYQRVWSAEPRRTNLCDHDVCLARYFDEGQGEPPEVEPGHFAWFYQEHAKRHGHCPAPKADPDSQAKFVECADELAARYRTGKLADPAIDAFFRNDRCVRESGHDTTYRWFSDGKERCTEFVPVELSALLFKYEIDLARFLAEHFGGAFEGATTSALCERARARARLVQKYHWDETAGAFFDYDLSGRRRSGYLSATTFAPLWASVQNPCGVSLVNAAMAERVRAAALPALEVAGGLSATAKSSLARISVPATLGRDANGVIVSRPNDRQWEYPNGWAPHQMLAWDGLTRFGAKRDAQRLAYRWLSTIVDSAADYHGTVPEKFDVVKRSHRVFQEYGNVNTEFSYIADEGFGWMNASFLVGLTLLDEKARSALAARASVESVFTNAEDGVRAR